MFLAMGKLVDVGTYEFGDNDRTLAAGANEWLLSKRTNVKNKELDNFNDFLVQHCGCRD